MINGLFKNVDAWQKGVHRFIETPRNGDAKGPSSNHFVSANSMHDHHSFPCLQLCLLLAATLNETDSL
jgi:hypothetical protein